MTVLLYAQRVLIQFKIAGPVAAYRFPNGFQVSVETSEEGEMRRARTGIKKGVQLECYAPVWADLCFDKLTDAGLILSRAMAQQRPAFKKDHTVVSFAFTRAGVRCSRQIVDYLDQLARGFWTKHYGFEHPEEASINLRFESQAQYPKHWAADEPNEFGVARIRNRSEIHKQAEKQAVAS